MKPDRKFLRQCCICKSYKTKEELIRITKDYKTSEAVMNKDNKVQGRSVYICENNECIKKFMKNKKSLTSLKVKNIEDIKNILGSRLC